MAKQIVKFLRTHGRYVKGDVAGFDAATIARWPVGVCVPYDLKATSTEIATLNIEASEAKAAIAAAQADIAQAADELTAREAAIAAREAALNEREAVTAPAPDAKENPAPQKLSDKAAGAPPKQGAKT